MPKQCINVDGGPPALGPYSHAVVAGNLLFLSGQGPVAADGSGIVRGSFEAETRATFANVKTILEGAGSSLHSVVKVTAYLADMERFKELNELYKEYFTSNYPARTCIQAGRLPGDIQVEIDVVALLGNES